MLHDAARKGDVEIPYFCYEPKLGEPVGACRMCLVEIEGIPKLQTSCSTPVREGMVVHTRTEQVKEAQNSVVEFLLVNHPLDCPVCDKGGECPLQDISYGWGPGRSRVIDEKRHFEKPIELSPLVAIDRERCILCYRCVRFSQEVAEDAQLQLIERGDRTYVGTFDDRPYVAPFHGNITDICPVGALTSYTYRFRARPWDIEHAGSVCTLCPSQCNVSFTVRDEKVKRVVDPRQPRRRRRLALRPRPLRVRDVRRARAGARAAAERRRGELGAGAGGGRRGLRAAADMTTPSGVKSAAPSRVAAIVGDASNEEGFLLQRIVREALGSAHVDSRPSRGPERRRCCGGWPSRRSRPRSATSTRPTRSSSSAPTRCTAARSSTCASARRSAATAPSWSSPPSARPRSTAAPRRSPATPPARPPTSSPSWQARSAAAKTSPPRSPRPCATPARSSSSGASGSPARTAPPRPSSTSPRHRAWPPPTAPACSKSPTPPTPAACARRAASPTPARASPRPPPACRPRRSASALISGEITGLVLFGADPLRDFPDTPAWEEALTAADFVVFFSMHENATTAKADVVLPLETHAEKDGTVTHPDGRLQRVRPSASRPEDVLPNILVLSELAAKLGLTTGIDSQPTAFAALTEAVPFYTGITDEHIGGRGIRWQDRAGAVSDPTDASGRPAQWTPRMRWASPECPARHADGRRRLRRWVR